MRCYYDQQIFMTQATGGISRYFFELIRRIGATGAIQPTLFAGLYMSRLPLHTINHCRVWGVRRGFKIGPLWPLAYRACDAINQRVVRRLTPAIYHPTYYRPVAQPAGTRLVVTVYDMIHEKFPHLDSGGDTAKIKRAACVAADAIICISESSRQDLLDYYPQFAAKTSVVYLAAAPDFGAMGPTSSAKPISTPPYALFVGNRNGYKGFDIALEAWQQLAPMFPEMRLVCVGGGAFTAAELAEIQRRGLGAKVSQRTADDGELANLYRQAECFIYPSSYEGFGLPVLEAMVCGCPVICSRSSSLPEVGGAAASYFEPGDASDLSAKISQAVGDTAHCEGMIQAGYEQQQRFSWEKCARQTAEVYRRCAGAN